MRLAGLSPVSDVCSQTLPAQCENCYLNFTEKAYDCLTEEGFKHLKVNHKLNFVDPKSKAHTNTIERKWRDIKSKVPRYGRREGFFIGYLAVAYFKLHFKDTTQRMHVFAKLAGQLYSPTRAC